MSREVIWKLLDKDQHETLSLRSVFYHVAHKFLITVALLLNEPGLQNTGICYDCFISSNKSTIFACERFIQNSMSVLNRVMWSEYIKMYLALDRDYLYSPHYKIWTNSSNSLLSHNLWSLVRLGLQNNTLLFKLEFDQIWKSPYCTFWIESEIQKLRLNYYLLYRNCVNMYCMLMKLKFTSKD